MNLAEIEKRLKEPFPFEDIEWKPQLSSEKNMSVMAVPYVDSRAIQDRLDAVVGPFGWYDEYKLWHKDSQICGIAIFDPENKIWVQKHDGAENTDISPVKGGISDAFKRSAVKWGLGRYLYAVDEIWVPAVKNYKGKLELSVNAYPNLRAFYIEQLQKLNLYDESKHGMANVAQTQSPPESSQPPTQGQPPATLVYQYRIKSAIPSGSSFALQLLDTGGNECTAYAPATHTALQPGVMLNNVEFAKGTSTFGDYYTLSSYEIAA